MKTFLFALIFSVGSITLHAADTAYNALRVVGKQSGADSLNRVAEVHGRNGVPAPAVWKVVFEEPRARGGVREMEVQRGQVISERTPTGKVLGSAMNFNQLNLDSDGAFTIANQQAEKAGVAFDRVDYLLKAGANGGAPVWELKLLNSREGQVGSLHIAADSGTVLRQEGLANRDRSAASKHRDSEAEDRDFVEPTRDARPPDEEKERIRDAPSLFRRAGRHFERRGYQIRNFFTGK